MSDEAQPPFLPLATARVRRALGAIDHTGGIAHSGLTISDNSRLPRRPLQSAPNGFDDPASRCWTPLPNFK